MKSFHIIIYYFYFYLLLGPFTKIKCSNGNFVFVFNLAWIFNFQPLYDVFQCIYNSRIINEIGSPIKKKSPISDSNPRQLLASDYQSNVMYL